MPWPSLRLRHLSLCTSFRSSRGKKWKEIWTHDPLKGYASTGLLYWLRLTDTRCKEKNSSVVGWGWSPSDFRGPKTGLHYLKTKMHAFLIKQTTFGVHPVPVCSWDVDFLRGWLQKIVLDFMWNAGHMVAQWLLLLPHSKEVTGSHSCWTISVLSLHALPLCTRVFCRFSGFPPRVQKHACVG